MKNELFLTSNFVVKGMDEEDDKIKIEGFANTTTKDRAGDIILEEAWVKGGLDNYLKNPIMLAFHDHTKPVGLMVDYSVNANGFRITAEISKAAGDVYNLVKQGVLKAFSVGFRILDADYNSDMDLFVIKDLELFEISVVSVPANADSVFSVQKALGNEQDYNEYKSSFNKKTLEILPSDNIGEEPVSKDNQISLTPEELVEKEAAAVTKALADIAAKEKAEKEADARVSAAVLKEANTGAERLMAEMEKRLLDENKSVTESLEGLRTELAEKATEIAAMQKNKMSFQSGDAEGKLTKAEIKEVDGAVLLSKIMGVPVDKTAYFKGLVEKAGSHLTGTNADNYETEFSARMYDAIADRLVIEPLFGSRIAMNSRSMVFPFNPEAGHAAWVTSAQYKSTNNDSTGKAVTHSVQDITLKAEKLATREAIGYEEEEDAIIPILPIIQAAVGRRMARTTDLELLRGAIGVETAAGQTNPALISGIATLGIAAGSVFAQGGAFGPANPITVLDLQATRRTMGVYGMDPKDITYVVNQDAYFDLLDDPDFRTMDLVGVNATLITGQIGTVSGSPVVVSDAFEAPALSTVAAVAVNTSNYLFGELRGITTERDTDVLNQTNWLVSTRRFAFSELIAGASSTGVLLYPPA